MAHVSYTELRNNLASYMDEVCDDRAPLFVTRQNARTVVLMAEDEYESSHGDRSPPEELPPMHCVFYVPSRKRTREN